MSSYVDDDGANAAWTAVHAMMKDDPRAVADALGNWCEDTGNDDYKFLFWAIAHEPGDGTFDGETEGWVCQRVADLLAKWTPQAARDKFEARVMLAIVDAIADLQTPERPV